MKKLLPILLTIVAIGGIWFYQVQPNLPLTKETPTLTTTNSEQTSTGSSTQTITQKNQQGQILLTAEADGQTALELLEAKTDTLKTKDYGEAGVFVESINDLAADADHYWAFYVNDEYARQGVKQTVLQKGDKIKFAYEEIHNAEF